MVPGSTFQKKQKLGKLLAILGKITSFFLSVFSGISDHSAGFAKFRLKDFAAQGVRMIT